MTSATRAGAGTDGSAHVHVHVTGIVQGVGYRPFVWGLATARGLAGWVRNAGRDGEQTHLTTLGELADARLDMFCTVVIGNSQTYVRDGLMITPRGYRGKRF